jgi:hypothetical protein
MKFHDFSPFYRSGEGIRSKVAGDRLIDNPAVADSVGGSGASFSFDGDGDHVEVSDDADIDVGTADFSIEMWVKPDNITQTGKYLINKEAGGIGYGLRIDTDDLYLRLDDNTTDISATIASNVFVAGSWTHLLVTCNRDGDATAYADGVSQGTVTISTASATLDNSGALRIGTETSGTTNEFAGSVSQVRLHNRALSAAEVRAAYNGQAVPFEYRGASQDDLITGSSIWADGGGSNIGTVTTNSDNDVTWGQTGAGDTGTNQVNASLGHWILANGTAYRVSFKAKVSSGTATLKHRPWGDDAKDWNLTTSFQDFSFEEVLTAGENNAYFYSTSSSSLTYTIEDYKITQIGCVAEYLPSGVGHGMWLDGSGNELHGSVSGATAIGIGSNHREKYVDLTVTGDTSFALPKGYRVAAITTKETAGNTLGGGMDVGTTNGGGEVVAAHAITASTTAIATIVASGSIGGTHTTADDTLYITDADGTGWDSASVEVRVEMERLIV